MGGDGVLCLKVYGRQRFSTELVSPQRRRGWAAERILSSTTAQPPPPSRTLPGTEGITTSSTTETDSEDTEFIVDVCFVAVFSCCRAGSFHSTSAGITRQQQPNPTILSMIGISYYLFFLRWSSQTLPCSNRSLGWSKAHGKSKILFLWIRCLMQRRHWGELEPAPPNLSSTLPKNWKGNQ